MQTKDCGKIVLTIFYPDAKRGAQMVESFHRSLKNFGESDAFDTRPWRLDVLEWPEMRTQAAQDVASSDLVVIPADDAFAGSDFFRRWVESWPIALDGCSLVLVSNRKAGDTASSRLQLQFASWLQELAVRKGMEFADARVDDGLTQPRSGFGEMKAAGPARGFSPGLGGPQVGGGNLMDGQLPPAPRFLGLNE